MRPLLRWAGSKKQLLPALRNNWNLNNFQRYVEPFAGSGALFFDLEPPAALLSDTNNQLIDFYKCMQRDAALVYELAISWAIDAPTYYMLRAELPITADKIRQSAIFFYLNRNCFNGIYRTNKAGQFNVPFSGIKTGLIPKWEEVNACSTLLKNAELVCEDFRTLISKRVDSGDFVYLDPPYAAENERVFTQYSARNFGMSDTQELSEFLHCIDAMEAKFLLSYALSTESKHFFKKWRNTEIECQRNVAGFSHKRRIASELIVAN